MRERYCLYLHLSCRIILAAFLVAYCHDISGSSHMTWKDRKDLENRKVVALGGKVKTSFPESGF